MKNNQDSLIKNIKKNLHKSVTTENLLKLIIWGLLVKLFHDWCRMRYIKYPDIYKWWNDFKGPALSKMDINKNTFDINAYLLYNYGDGALLYDVYSFLSFSPAAKEIGKKERFNEICNHFVLRNFRTSPIRPIDKRDVTDPDTYDHNLDLNSKNYTTPAALFSSILIENDQRDWFRTAMISSYGQLPYPPAWYNNWCKEGMPDPIGRHWATITKNKGCRGFWPSNNGAFDFFALPTTGGSDPDSFRNGNSGVDKYSAGDDLDAPSPDQQWGKMIIPWYTFLEHEMLVGRGLNYLPIGDVCMKKGKKRVIQQLLMII